MRIARRTMLVAASLAMGAALAGPALAQEKLAVGAYPANPPWQFKNEKGEFEGFEVEMVREISKRLNLTPEISDMGFQALFAATSSGRIDMAISSITITPERLKSQSFTQAHYDSDLGIASQKAKPIKSPEELKGKTVGVLSTSTGDKWTKENQAKYGVATIRGYNQQTEMLLDLAAGRVDAVISDVPGMDYSFTKMKDLAVTSRIKTGEQYALMMRKNHPLLEKVNATVTAMKKDGTLPAIHKKWFGTDAPADSSTAQERPLPKE
ncbi:ABC transporter substrate-binding protein [Alsobacter sp. R-9]